MSPKNPVRVPSDDEILKGHDIRSLGPSDSSDTGADMMGIEGLDSTSDRQGTGERQSIEGLPGEDLDLRPKRSSASPTRRSRKSLRLMTTSRRPRRAVQQRPSRSP